MHGTGKSDLPIVPVKPMNKAGRSAAESVEGSGGTKRNAVQQSTVRTQSRDAVTQAQDRIRGATNQNRRNKFTALLHHVNVDVLRWSFFSLKKQAAPGTDGVTWDQYAQDLESNLANLHARVHAGTYRAQPVRRRYIPKTDGRLRPLGIAAIEDKIVQSAVVTLLTPIYEAEFLGFSYGFRPERSQHDALDALAYGIKPRKICWILDSDIQSFFDEFGRNAAGDRERRGDGKPETFNFLGLTHICGTKKDGKTFQLWRRTQRERLRAKLKEIKQALKVRWHLPLRQQGPWLGSVVRGYFA